MLLRFCYAVAIGVTLIFPSGVALSAAEDVDAKNAHTEPAAASAQGSHHKVHIGAKGVNMDAAEFKRDLSIYTFIVFLLLLGILWKFAWGPLAEGLDKREAGIRKDIADAEDARLKAERMLSQHAEKLDKVQDEIREIIAEARRDAEHTKNDIIETAQKEADVTRQRALREIERAKDQALDELFSRMSGTVAQATEYVVGRSLTDSDRDRLVEEALSQFRNN